MIYKKSIWKNIIPNFCSEEILDKLKLISEILIKEPFNSNNSLLSGKVGLSLFLNYYIYFTENKKLSDNGLKYLEQVFININNGFNYHTFAGGLSGILWGINHLYNNSFILEDPKDINLSLESYFIRMVEEEINQKNIDYLHGSLGVILYLLERNTEKVNIAISEFVDILGEQGEISGNSIKWMRVLDKEKDIKGYNLSLSHGIASIIIILAQIYEKGINKEKALKLIRMAINFLLDQKQDPQKNLSIFPNWISKDLRSRNSRLAWCYGDLGIGIALYQTAVIIKDSQLENDSIEILKHSAKRRDLKENRIIDAGLCHGTAGIAHIFNRMFNYTGNEEFRDAAIYWIDKTLEMAKFPDGLAGYKIWRSEKYGGWVNDTGLLEGIAGIGMMLISAVSDIEPKWDRCLLLS